MAEFHGPHASLVLQDEAGVWARSERDHAEIDPARRGKVVLSAADASRFRAVAEQYGFVEDKAPAKSVKAPQQKPVSDD